MKHGSNPLFGVWHNVGVLVASTVSAEARLPDSARLTIMLLSPGRRRRTLKRVSSRTPGEKRNIVSRRRYLAFAIAFCLLCLVNGPACAADPEIDQLLKSPVGEDWVTNGGNLTNQRYATLKQINTSTPGSSTAPG